MRKWSFLHRHRSPVRENHLQIIQVVPTEVIPGLGFGALSEEQLHDVQMPVGGGAEKRSLAVFPFDARIVDVGAT